MNSVEIGFVIIGLTNAVVVGVAFGAVKADTLNIKRYLFNGLEKHLGKLDEHTGAQGESIARIESRCETLHGKD